MTVTTLTSSLNIFADEGEGKC